MAIKVLDGLTLKEVKAICQPESSRGQWSMNLLRKLSIFMSIGAIHLKISAMAVTFARFFVGVAGIFLIGLGGYTNIVIGLLIFHLASVMDFMDGEIFRYVTWKTKKRSTFLMGTYLDKIFDGFYRPLLLIAAGVGLWRSSGSELYLYLGIAGTLLVFADQFIKIKSLEVLVHKRQMGYLVEQKGAIEGASKKLDWLYEPFRINNPLSLYFFAGIFGVLNYFIILYVPLLFLFFIKTFFNQYGSMKRIDVEVMKEMTKGSKQ